jgi:hypothetical protein
MKNKWLFWGVIVFVISIFGYVVAVIFSALTFGKFRLMANIFGYIAAWSMPVAVVLAFLNRKSKKPFDKNSG